MLFTNNNSNAQAANQRTSAKRTELFSFEHMKTLSLTKRAQFTNTCERVYNHLLIIRDLCTLPDNLNTDIVPPSISNDKEYFTHVVRDNTTVLDCVSNWNLLLNKEAYYIKRLTPSLNNGLKSSIELHLLS